MDEKNTKITPGSLCRFVEVDPEDENTNKVYTLLSDNSIYYDIGSKAKVKTCILMDEKNGNGITISYDYFSDAIRKCTVEESLDFIKEVAFENYSLYGWRYGQYAFNLATNYFPKEANQLRGTKFDPIFYDEEEKVNGFIEALRALIAENNSKEDEK